MYDPSYVQLSEKVSALLDLFFGLTQEFTINY